MSIEMHRCPNCRRPLQVTELTCPACDLRLHGQFERGCKFCALDPEQRRLLDVFLSCRGVIRDMEKALDLSYPTVRARVDSLLQALGYLPTEPEAEAAKRAAKEAAKRYLSPKPKAGEQESAAARRQEILDRLASGEITAEEAAAALQEAAG